MIKIKLGTRASALALAQSETLKEELVQKTANSIEVELVTFTTIGDSTAAKFKDIGSAGVFVSNLRTALKRNECDFVVHSYKDLPTETDSNFVIASVPARADARDCLCAKTEYDLSSLPSGSRVGTGSMRRIAQLRNLRPDLIPVPIRGNIDSRLNRLDLDLDAVILAVAGVNRLAKTAYIKEIFNLIDWPTAPAQGALAIEVNYNSPIQNLFKVVDNLLARATASWERKVLNILGVGCSAAVGISTITQGMDKYQLVAKAYSEFGNKIISTQSEVVSISDILEYGENLALVVAQNLINAGVKKIIS